MSDQVPERVCKVIAATKRIPPEDVTPTATFEDLHIDSLDGVNILFELENEFDISIPDEEARKIRSVPEMIEGVRRLLSAKSAPAE